MKKEQVLTLLIDSIGKGLSATQDLYSGLASRLDANAERADIRDAHTVRLTEDVRQIRRGVHDLKDLLTALIVQQELLVRQAIDEKKPTSGEWQTVKETLAATLAKM